MKEIEDAMKDIDDDLKHTLQREEPPAGFADRVLLRVAEQRGKTLLFPTGVKPGPTGVKPRLPFVQWAAAAALVAAVAGGVDYIAKQEERAEGEAAKERVVLALHIAGSKLQLVQSRISRMHEPPAKNLNQ